MLFLASFAAMMGPLTYAQHLFSGTRLPFTAAYFGSIAMTLYFSLGVSHSCLLRRQSVSCSLHRDLWLRLVTDLCLLPEQLHSTILTLFSSIIQLACLAWYLVSYFPMGSSGLRLASSFGAQRATAWLTG